MTKMLSKMLAAILLSIAAIFAGPAFTIYASTPAFVPTKIEIQQAIPYSASASIGTYTYTMNTSGKTICSVIGANINGSPMTFVFILDSQDFKSTTMLSALIEAKKSAKAISLFYMNIANDLNTMATVEWATPYYNPSNNYYNAIKNYPLAFGIGI